jgi:heptosyltransferase II
VRVGIFHTAFLGDIALCGLLIDALYKENHEIYLITRKAATLLYKEDYRIKGCLVADKKSGLGKIRSIFLIANQIKNLKLDVLLVPHKSVTSAFCSYLTKVPKRISYDDTSLGSAYTELRPFYKEKHECLRCLDIAPEWLVSKNVYQEAIKLARPVLIPGRNLSKFLSFNPSYFENDLPFFIVSPGSVWATKKYPALHFAKAIFSLLSKNKILRCVISGTSQDKSDINEILNFFSTFPNLLSRVIDTSSYLPLDEFVTLISKASFVIANDSSPIHIASGSNIPVIGIFGPTSWKFGFYPTSEKSIILNYKDENGNTLSCHPCTPHGSNECPKKHFRCMRDLSPDLLVESVRKLLPDLFE